MDTKTYYEVRDREGALAEGPFNHLNLATAEQRRQNREGYYGPYTVVRVVEELVKPQYNDPELKIGDIVQNEGGPLYGSSGRWLYAPGSPTGHVFLQVEDGSWNGLSDARADLPVRLEVVGRPEHA